MAIIKKRADELKIGDVLSARVGHAPERVVHYVHRGTGSVCPHTYPTGAAIARPPYAPELYNGSDIVDVEVPDGAVSPEDVSALVEAAGAYLRLADSGDAGRIMDDRFRNALTALVERLRPPEPPTLPEVLAALDLLQINDRRVADSPAAQDVLQRARRAGLL